MKPDQRLEQTISSWLEQEAPRQLPDRVLRVTFERTRKARQKVGWQAVLGRFPMNRSFFALGGAAVVVVAAVLGLGIYFNGPGVGAPPSPSPTNGPSPNPTSASTATPAATATPASSATPASNTPEAGLPEGPYALEPDGSFSSEDSGMALTVTIPASGWTFDRNWALLSKGTEVDNVPEAAILFWAFPGQEFYVPADACRMDSTRPETPVTTVDELAAALAERPSTPEVSEPVDVTVGGYEGKYITLQVPENAEFGECEQGDLVYYITSPDNFWRNSQGPGQMEEIWILDVDGTVVIIDEVYRADTSAELIEEMRGMVESTTFEAP